MVQYTDIHLNDLKNLSLKSFTQVLINDYYPFIYAELNKLEECINRMKLDYDVHVLVTIHQAMYAEFDELYRKEKVVLFPYIIKLDEENIKSENCLPFKNTKLHYTSVINHITTASGIVSNYFISDINNDSINCLNTLLSALKENLNELQYIKEQHFYKNYKNCGACKTIHE